MMNDILPEMKSNRKRSELDEMLKVSSADIASSQSSSRMASILSRYSERSMFSIESTSDLTLQHSNREAVLWTEKSASASSVKCTNNPISPPPTEEDLLRQRIQKRIESLNTPTNTRNDEKISTNDNLRYTTVNDDNRSISMSLHDHHEESSDHSFIREKSSTSSCTLFQTANDTNDLMSMPRSHCSSISVDSSLWSMSQTLSQLSPPAAPLSLPIIPSQSTYLTKAQNLAKEWKHRASILGLRLPDISEGDDGTVGTSGSIGTTTSTEISSLISFENPDKDKVYETLEKLGKARKVADMWRTKSTILDSNDTHDNLGDKKGRKGARNIECDEGKGLCQLETCDSSSGKSLEGITSGNATENLLNLVDYDASCVDITSVPTDLDALENSGGLPITPSFEADCAAGPFPQALDFFMCEDNRNSYHVHIPMYKSPTCVKWIGSDYFFEQQQQYTNKQFDLHNEIKAQSNREWVEFNVMISFGLLTRNTDTPPPGDYHSDDIVGVKIASQITNPKSISPILANIMDNFASTIRWVAQLNADKAIFRFSANSFPYVVGVKPDGETKFAVIYAWFCFVFFVSKIFKREMGKGISCYNFSPECITHFISGRFVAPLNRPGIVRSLVRSSIPVFICSSTSNSRKSAESLVRGALSNSIRNGHLKTWST